MGKRKTKAFTGTVADISTAFGAIEELKDELQEWYDNLPENFQNGDKGSQLQDAVSNLEQDSEPSIPDCCEEMSITWYEVTNRKGRATRCANAVAIVDSAISEVESKIAELEEYTYNDDGKRHENGTILAEGDYLEEDERDSAKDELETFRDELDNAKSNWENTEFPGMFG